MELVLTVSELACAEVTTCTDGGSERSEIGTLSTVGLLTVKFRVNMSIASAREK